MRLRRAEVPASYRARPGDIRLSPSRLDPFGYVLGDTDLGMDVWMDLLIALLWG